MIEAEQELARRHEQLQDVNLQLEQFSHMAAHDLREPVRRLAAMADVFINEYSHSIPADGQHVLNYIKTEATSMIELISDFRFLTEIGHPDKAKKVDVDLQELIQEVIAETKATPAKKQTTFTVPERVVVRAYKSLLHSLYRNLVSNALKHAEALTEVVFTCETRDTEIALGVKNNGSTIKPELALQVFDPFKRFSQKHRGSGLGLYICKKVVEAHEGKIWLETGDNEVHFRFTLPVRSGE